MMKLDADKPELTLLNARSGLDCDERESSLHAEETVRAVGLVEAELGKGAAFAVRTSFLDPAHEGAERYYLLSESEEEADFRELGQILEATDYKNMVDVAIEGETGNLVFVSNGQGYWFDEKEHHNVREAVAVRRLTLPSEGIARCAESRGLLKEAFHDVQATEPPTHLIEKIKQSIMQTQRERKAGPNTLEATLSRVQAAAADQNNRRIEEPSAKREVRRR